MFRRQKVTLSWLHSLNVLLWFLVWGAIFVSLCIMFPTSPFSAKCRLLTILSGHTDTLKSLSFSPDGKFLLSVGWDDRLCVWDLQTGQIVNVFEYHFWGEGSAFF